MTRRDRLWVAGIKGLIASIIATLGVRWAALATLEIPAEFPPLAGPGPTIFFTAVAALGAAGVFGIIHRHANRPEYVFRWIAVGILLISSLPDLWLLSDGAVDAFPGASPSAVGVLMLMHVTAAVVIVWFLTVRGR